METLKIISVCKYVKQTNSSYLQCVKMCEEILSGVNKVC